jgi:hypothetical protein
VVDHAAVPLIEGTRAAARAGHLPGGSRWSLEWVLPHTDAGAVSEEDLLLLADAQTSGGLLVAGELRGAPVIGELIARRDSVLIIRRARRPSRTALPCRTRSVRGSGGSPLACMACAGACRRTGYQANDGSVGHCGPTEALQGGTGDWDDAG